MLFTSILGDKLLRFNWLLGTISDFAKYHETRILNNFMSFKKTVLICMKLKFSDADFTLVYQGCVHIKGFFLKFECFSSVWFPAKKSIHAM